MWRSPAFCSPSSSPSTSGKSWTGNVCWRATSSSSARVPGSACGPGAWYASPRLHHERTSYDRRPDDVHAASRGGESGRHLRGLRRRRRTRRGQAARRLDGVFLVTTIATSVTGFGFPFVTFLPSHAVGIISLVVLAAVIVARYVKHLAGAWRRIYVAGTVVALYLNVFVLVVQLFRRLPALVVAAPKQEEPPFLLTQLLVLALFAWLGRAAARGFRSVPGGVA